ncbi:MAG: holo-ACP synthase [Elusimicrobia bacterium]|nr:holo-ACP synthase [Elusimicrobiota bacterium]
MIRVPRLGVDIVEIPRVARLIRSRRFLRRVFTPQEVDYCLSKKHRAQHFAVRFAAKEAVWKALGDPRLGHRDISVTNRQSGEPRVVLPGRWAKEASRVTISLSHGAEYAVAVALYSRS